MGIAGNKPRQLAPTIGTTGSGSTDSLAPSPTIIDVASPTFIGTTSPRQIEIDT
jgi:hypothetical protein